MWVKFFHRRLPNDVEQNVKLRRAFFNNISFNKRHHQHHQNFQLQL